MHNKMQRMLFSSITSVSEIPKQQLPSTKIVSKFYTPRQQRASPESIYEIDNLYDKRIKRRRRIDPTRELNYTSEHWENHKSPYRRIKHTLTTFGASPFQRLLFPDMFITSLTALGLTYYNEVMAINEASQLWMDSSGLAAGTTAIGLLTGFRLNASYNRYQDGRKQMSNINTASRNLASNAFMWITSRNERDRMIHLIKAFSVGMTFHLNKKGNHVSIRRCDPNFDEQIYAEYLAEMTDVFQNDQDEDLIRVCKWFREKQNVPLGIATLLRGIIARNDQQKDALNRELDLHVQKLLVSLGGCERIQKTPMKVRVCIVLSCEFSIHGIFVIWLLISYLLLLIALANLCTNIRLCSSLFIVINCETLIFQTNMLHKVSIFLFVCTDV